PPPPPDGRKSVVTRRLRRPALRLAAHPPPSTPDGLPRRPNAGPRRVRRVARPRGGATPGDRVRHCLRPIRGPRLRRARRRLLAQTIRHDAFPRIVRPRQGTNRKSRTHRRGRPPPHPASRLPGAGWTEHGRTG